jgi:PIN domain nuclease of toxin-antitoxin system
VRVLVDTVTLLYAIKTPERLSKRARAVLDNAANVRELSVLSLNEIALKRSVGKMDVTRDDVLQAIAGLQLSVLPYSAEHALEFFDVPTYHGDPFDRQLIAQLLCEKIPIVTPDEQFRRYAGVKVVW